MKIANITLTGLFNLGNRLQLYAMQQILGKYGEVENVEWLSPKSNCLAPLKNDIKIGIKLFLSQFFTKYKRFKSFYKFNKSNKVEEYLPKCLDSLTNQTLKLVK